MTASRDLLVFTRNTGDALSLFVKDIGQGLLVVSHNALALLGLAVVALGLTFSTQANLRSQLEQQTLGWLNARSEARFEADGNVLAGLNDSDAVSRATAVDPRELPRQQAVVAQWLARRYKVAPEPLSRLVQEAWATGQRAHLEPTLILAVMAVESSFNPFAQSNVGAQGLMQVMTRVHDDKYEAFGGDMAAFDPVTNLRVGVQVLKDCIQHNGGVETGLRCYVGAGHLADDDGYAGRVLAEYDLLKEVAAGQNVSTSAVAVLRAPAHEASAPHDGEQVALAH